jgi:hypothetical protein
LGLSEDPGELLREHSVALDGVWRGMAESLTAATVAHVGSDGRLHGECRRNRVRLVERIPHAFIYIRSFRSDFLF